MLRSRLEALGPQSPVYQAARAVHRAPERAYWTWVSLLPLEKRRKILYKKVHGQELRLDPPTLFSEKVNWRIIHDRRPLLSWTCDKLKMKEYASTFPGLHVPRTLWSGTDVGELAAMDLPERWVLKPNHRSGVVYFGHGRADRAELLAATSGWMKNLQTDRLGEWAYAEAQPCLVAEEWIGEGDAVPIDYKIFVFDGVPAVVNVHTERFGDHGKRYYSPDWTLLGTVDGVPAGPDTPRPAALDEMLEYAAKLGAPFDFMRIDLFWTNNRIYFGETTPYPGGGLLKLHPHSLEEDFGARWTLPALE